MPTNGRSAYGPLAETFARSFEPTDPVVLFDHIGVAEALRECAARRFCNETFFVRAILQREHALRADAIAANVFTSFESRDDRMAALDQAFAGSLSVNNRPLSEIPAYSPEALRLMQAALRLADALVVSSESERRRISGLLLTDPRSVLMPRRDPNVPQPTGALAAKRDAVLIWAPHLKGEAGLAFALALTELRLPLLLVSSTAPPKNEIAQWIPAEHAGASLERAKLILDANPYGCDSALALATWGAPLVADVESGAQELLDGVRVFGRERLGSIFEAAVAALGMPAPTERRRGDAAFAVSEPLLHDGPLVSIVIPTLDRPAMLRDALASIRAQTYRNVETIVVVDGGPRLDEMALDFPEVCFIHMPENNPLHSSNTAFSRTSGDYVTFLNDDDVYFPNHVAALVTALERSGESVAHGDVLTAFLRGGDDRWQLYGFESNMSRATSASGFLVGNMIGMTSCMFRRRCIADGIAFEESVPLYRDYALWLRLAVEYDFVHVERLTSCYTIRNDGAAQQSNVYYDKALRSYEVLYDLYPVPDRPALLQQRARVLQSVTDEQMRLKAHPAGEVQPVAWPLWTS
jgi:hypothetical protein